MDTERESMGAATRVKSQLLAGAEVHIAELFGLRVREARRTRGLSQEALGAKLGEYLGKPWPKQIVYGVETGQRECKLSELVALAAVLDRPLTWLLQTPTPDQGVHMPGVWVIRGWALQRHLLGQLEPAPVVGKVVGEITGELSRELGNLRRWLDQVDKRVEAMAEFAAEQEGRGDGAD